MLTSLIIDGIAKLIWIRKDSNKNKSVCRIYSITGTIPEKVIDEVIPGTGLFRDKETNQRFKFTGKNLIAL